MKTEKGVTMHPVLIKALRAKPGALGVFNRMRPSCREEYSDWVSSAKNEETQRRRITSVIRKVEDWGGRHPAKPKVEKASTLKRILHPMPQFARKELVSRGLMGAYQARPPYQRNDYIGWINRAVREETKRKRLNQMLDELDRGDSYMGMEYRDVSFPLKIVFQG